MRALPGFAVIEADATKEFFFVHLGFDEIDSELRAVSVVLGFHAVEGLLEPGADYFLRQYTGQFIAGKESESARLLVLSLQEELKKRIEQDWLEL